MVKHEFFSSSDIESNKKQRGNALLFAVCTFVIAQLGLNGSCPRKTAVAMFCKTETTLTLTHDVRLNTMSAALIKCVYYDVIRTIRVTEKRHRTRMTDGRCYTCNFVRRHIIIRRRRRRRRHYTRIIAAVYLGVYIYTHTSILYK